MDSFSDIALRIVAAFYAFLQFIGIRRLAMDRLLDNAIAAISGKTDASSQARAERLRWQTMLLLLVIGAPGSILTVAMMSTAIPLLVLTTVLSVANIAYVLPKFVDPHEPPDPAARRRSWIATFFFLIFTLWAIHHWRSGGMTGTTETHPLVAAIAIGLILLFAAYAFSTLRKTRLGKVGALGAGAAYDEPLSEDYLAALEAEKASYRGAKFVLRPALGESPLFRADSGEVVPYHLPVEEIDDTTKEDMRNWQTQLRNALDRTDPKRARFASDKDRNAVLDRGKHLFERLRAALGAERVLFDPEPLAHAASFSPGHIIVRARVREWPTADADMAEDPIFPGDLGLSMQLEDDLLDWAGEYDEASLAAADGEFLSGKPDWTRERWADFEACGKALAERIGQEFAATERANIRVGYLEPEIGPDAPR